MAEAKWTAENGCAAQVHLPRLEDNRLMERNTMKLVVLPKKDTEQDGFPRNLHFLPLFCRHGVLPVKSSCIRDLANAPSLAILQPERGRKPTE